MTTTIERPPPEGAADRPEHRAEVAALLATGPEDVAGVVARLAELQEVLERGWGKEDGLSFFNHVYTQITRGIAEQLATDLFADREFLERFDVEFARRYLAAVRADACGDTPPRAWAVLLRQRSNPRINPMGFAVAGVNAHVNYDLAPALVRTCTVLGRPSLGLDERQGFNAVNSVFALQMPRLLEHFEGWLLRTLDATLLEQLIGAVADVPVVLAREVAWRQALELWERRSKPAEYELECEALDKRTALVGRGLLTIAGLW